MASWRNCLAFALVLICLQYRSVAHHFEHASMHLIRVPANQTTTGLSPNITVVTQRPQTTVVQTRAPATKGIVNTTLEVEGRPSLQPFPTSFVASEISLTRPTSNHSFNLISSPSRSEAYPTRTANLTMSSKLPTGHKPNDLYKRATTDCFQPVATGPLPRQIRSRGDHPVRQFGITPQSNPVSTNKFYANLFLGTQGQGVWTHPYSVAWSKGTGSAKSWGMAVSHVDPDKRVFGPRNTAIPGAPIQYFISPIGIQSLILSAIELGPSTTLSTKFLEAFSGNAILSPRSNSSSSITYPLVQGMAFVTGIYNNLMPAIQSSVLFRTVTQVAPPQVGVFKYQITLEDNKIWLLYARSNNRHDPGLKLMSNILLQGTRGWSGTIQVAKNPVGSSGDSIYDGSAGVFPITAAVTGSVSGNEGIYRIQWTKSGLTNLPLLTYALPHHILSFDGPTDKGRTVLQLQTATKGVATAVIGDSWTLVEQNLPVDLDFAPWTPATRGRTALSESAVRLIQQVAAAEINQDYNSQTNLDSMYFSGKALAKFATVVYTTNDLLKQRDLAIQGLDQLKGAFARFVTNQQIHALVYDTVWKGVVSNGSYSTDDSGRDFGNTYYNDHHFHYAYFIYAAAVIAYLDPAWLGLNKDWVNTLVRDAANPNMLDNMFPFSRMFDWYHGHSFAKGLFESADSKDEESTSEDAFFSYAMKMWGHVIGDQSMEARGNLMLSIQAKTFTNYFLMQNNNVIQPANFIANKVTGVLFENKVDHTTYFGANPEYIQGVHMLPLSPASAFTRPRKFILEEWNAYFNTTSRWPASTIAGGWRSILYGNLACIDPKAAYQFFSQQHFDGAWLDGGASRTWYLAFSAAVGGA